MTQAQTNKDWAISLSDILADEYGYNTDHSHPNPNWSNSQAISSPDGTNVVLNGSNEYILAPNNESLNFGGAITLSTWLFRGDNGNDWRNVFTKGDSFIAELDPAGNLRFRGDNNDVRFNYENVVNIPKDQWANLAITLDEQGSTTIYLNGESVFQAQDPQGDVINQSAKGISIGFLENQSPYNPDIWMGGVDDVQIWDKALSGQQVKDWIYEKSGLSSDEYKQESSTHQLAHYEMNEGSGNILYDSSGKGNDAAIKQGLPAEFAASAEDIQTDASGNVYIAGNARAVDPNHPWASEQNLGPFVSKFSSDGSEVWTKTFQDPDVYLSSGHYGSPLDVSDNGTVALAINERLDYQQSSSEYFNGNGNGSENKGVLLKLDGADGSTVKEYVLDSGGSQALTTAISNAGDIYIVSGVDGGAYQQFIGRYTDTGKLWEVPIGIGARDAYSLNDSVMVNGIDQGGIIAEYSAESGALLSTISRGASVNAIDVSNGAIAVAGAEQLLNEAIGFVGLYDNQSQSNQGPKWVDTQNHPGWDEYLDVDFLENGNIVALGQTWWGPGAITEYDSDGDILWNPDLYPLQNDYQRSYAPYEIEVGDGNIYFLGIDDGNGRWGGKLGSTSDLHTILDAKSPPNTILDILEGSDQSNIVVIDASGSGSVDGTPFSNVQSIDLKGGDDTATVGTAGSVTSLIGGSGSDLLNLNSNNNAVTITGTGAGSSNGTNFTGFETLKTLAGDDTVTLSSSAGTTAALALDGGVGNDTLVANASNNLLTLTGVNQGTVDQVSFTEVENVRLGDGDDSIVFEDGGQLTGLLDGGNGNNTLTLPGGTPITIGGGGIGVPGGGTVIGIGSVQGGGANSIATNDLANAVNLTGAGSGVVDGTAFTSIQSIDLKGGNDTATIGTSGSLAGLLNGGSGTDSLNLNGGANDVWIKADGSGNANGTGTGTTWRTNVADFEVVDLLGGDDTATIDLLNPATAVRSLLLNGGDGNDVLDIKLSDQEFAELEDTDALMQLGSYLSDPTGKTLDIAFGDFTLNAIGFESATFNHVIPTDDQPPEAPTLNSVAASASDTTSASGLEGLNLDVGGAANVQAPVTLKSTSDASTVEGNVKSDAHATDVLGISTSTLHAASDLSVGSALQSIVSGSAESTSGIAIANALVDTQHGIDLTNPTGADALASGGSSTVISTSSLTATSTAQTVGDGISDSGPRLLDGAWANTIAEDHLGLGSTGVLTLDSESNSTVSTSMVSNLSSTATANDGLAVATAQLLSNTGIENLTAEVGGLGLVTAINQGVFKANAKSTTDDASALGINKASVGILDSTFSFGITDSTITAKDLNSLQVNATSTGGDAWSKLQSSSTGLADLTGIENRITDAGAISAIASDQGFANSATVSGSSTSFASQEAIGMSGYEVHNHSDLTLSAQALVSSESNSSAVGG